jgi:hypothetical protein
LRTSPLRTFGTNITAAAANIGTPQVATPTATRAPKPSSVSREAIDRARLSIQKVPAKRSLLETLVDLNEYDYKSCLCDTL